MVFLNSLTITRCIEDNMVDERIFDIQTCIQNNIRDWHIDINTLPSKIFIPMYNEPHKFTLFIFDFEQSVITICDTVTSKPQSLWKPAYDTLKYLLPRYFGYTDFMDWQLCTHNPMSNLFNNNNNEENTRDRENGFIYICMWAYLLGDLTECEKYVHHENVNSFIGYLYNTIDQDNLVKISTDTLIVKTKHS